MPAGVYKPAQTHGSTLQVLRVWQLRLEDIERALGRGDGAAAQRDVEGLRARLAPEAYPEFAANLDWLYRSIDAHVGQGQLAEAAEIAGSLRRLLALAAERLVAQRTGGAPAAGEEPPAAAAPGVDAG